jgi:hypothetical protein
MRRTLPATPHFACPDTARVGALLWWIWYIVFIRNLLGYSYRATINDELTIRTDKQG